MITVLENNKKIFKEDYIGEDYNPHLFYEWCNKISELLISKSLIDGKQPFKHNKLYIADIGFWIDGELDKDRNWITPPRLAFTKTPRFWDFNKLKYEFLLLEHELFQKQGFKFL